MSMSTLSRIRFHGDGSADVPSVNARSARALDDLDAFGCQEPGQACTVGVGALHAGPGEQAMVLSPSQQVALAGLLPGWSWWPASAEPFQTSRRRNVEVGVDAQRDLHFIACDRVHAVPSS